MIRVINNLLTCLKYVHMQNLYIEYRYLVVIHLILRSHHD